MNQDDPRYWKAGIFYYNREDPAILVPKRNGLGFGRTLNFGRPISWVLFAAPIGVALLSALSKR